MLTYTSRSTEFTTFTNNTSLVNVSNGNRWMDQFTLELIHKYPGLYNETSTLLQTYPSQQFYTLPLQLRKVNTVVINVGNTGGTTTTGAGFNWPAKECPTLQYWNQLNLTNNISSDIPYYYFFYNGQIGIYPKPSAGYNPITVKGFGEITGLSVADYITGTITAIPYALTLTGSLASGVVAATLTGSWSLPTGTYQMIFSDAENILVTLTNGSTAVTWTQALTAAVTSAVSIKTANGGDIVTGSGTTWITSMANYVFFASQPNGDGFFYRIDTVYDTTHLSLTTSYGGATITAGSVTYIIGQGSIIPQAYQYIPVFRTTELYYSIIKKEENLKKEFGEMAARLEAILEGDQGDKDSDPTVQDDFGTQIINPNLTVNITQSSTNQ